MPASYTNPPAPTIVSIASDELAMLSSPQSAPMPRLVALVGVSGGRDAVVRLEAGLRLVAQDGSTADSWLDVGQYPAARGLVDTTAVAVGNTYDLRVRGITATGRASDWVVTRHLVQGKQGGPPPMAALDVTSRPDGSRRVRWLLPAPLPPDAAGVRLRYGASGQDWVAMTQLHEQLLPLASPADLALPPAGTWQIGAVLVDLSGRESEPVMIEATLAAPSQANVIAIDDARSVGWSGTKTDCGVNGSNDLVGSSGMIIYEHGAYDLGDVVDVQPSVRVDADGLATVELAVSDDGVTYGDWTNATDYAGSLHRTRFIKMRATIYSTIDVATPTLYDLSLYVRGELTTHEITGLVMSGVPTEYRFATGDISLPLPAGFAGSVRSVHIGFVGSGYAGWTWALITRTGTPGPRIRVYNAAGTLADATIDAVVRAWPKTADLIGESGSGGYGGAGSGRNSEGAPPIS